MDSKSILTPFQSEFLKHFFQNEIGKRFFLTGGTALAAFYLVHRYSEDIDLFTVDNTGMEMVQPVLYALASVLGAEASISVATPTFRQLFFTRADESLKIDLVRDIDIQYGEHRNFDSVIVDSLENIGVNKITAIFGRTTAKDFVDLYFILQTGLDFWELVELAKEKDRGLTEFYLAGMMRQVQNLNRLPRMLKPLELDDLKIFFMDLEKEMMGRINPE